MSLELAGLLCFGRSGVAIYPGMGNFTPIIGLGDVAGSGKDTVGSWIADRYRGVCIGQADPMKRFAMKVFCFTEEQLWGPSEKRSEPDDRFNDANVWEWSYNRLCGLRDSFVREVWPTATEHQLGNAAESLLGWFRDLEGLVKDSPDTLSPRLALQTLGTEWGRDNLYRDVWVDYAERTATELLGGNRSYSRVLGIDESSKTNFDFVCLTDIRFRNECIKLRQKGAFLAKVNRPGAGLGGKLQKHSSESESKKIPPHFYNKIIHNDGTLEELFDKVRRMMEQAYGV